MLFFTDNEAIVHVIDKQSCKDKSLIHFVRKLVSICLQHNIVFKAKHIPGIYNHLADSLSRLQVTDFQTFGSSSHGSMPNRDSPVSAASELAAIVSTRMKSNLQPSSLPTYKRAWKLYNQFLHSTFHGVSVALPIPPPRLALFIAYLFDNHYASSTVSTCVSTLRYSHKLSGLPDPSQAFFIIQILKGYGKHGACLDSRLPIILPILDKLLQLPPDFHVQSIKSVNFKPCARLLFMPSLELAK